MKIKKAIALVAAFVTVFGPMSYAQQTAPDIAVAASDESTAETTTTTAVTITTAATTTAKPATTTTTAAATTAKPATTTTAKPATTTTTAAATTAKPAITTTTAATTTAKPATTTTTTVTTTTAAATTSVTTTSALTNEELMKNADVNDDGIINATDSSYAISCSIGNMEVSGSKGDVNGDGEVDINDAFYILDYYAKSQSEAFNTDDYFIALAKLPRNNGESITISRTSGECSANDDYSEFVLEYNVDSVGYCLSGQLLFNGKTFSEAGFKRLDMEFEEGGCAVNVKNGKFVANDQRNSNIKMIVRVFGGQSGEYTLTLDNLKCYDSDGVKYSSIKREGYDPVLNISSRTATITPRIPDKEEMKKNADINDDGVINAVDAAMILRSSVNNFDLSGSKGDVNCNGKVEINDAYYVLRYYALSAVRPEDAENYMDSLSRLPEKNGKTVTIKQALAEGDANAEFSEFALQVMSDSELGCFSGQILFNGKTYRKAGFKDMEISFDGAKASHDINEYDGSIAVHSIKGNDLKMIVRVYGGAPGEYMITYDDLKFFDADGVPYSGIVKKDYNPYITIIRTSAADKALGDYNGDGMIDAVDASNILAAYAKYSTGKAAPTVEEWNVCDVNKDGFIDAVDASKVLAYYAYTATDGKLGFEDFINNKA